MRFNNKLLRMILLLLFSIVCSSSAFAERNNNQSATPRKAGLMTFKLNSIQYSADLFEEITPGSYRILCGNKNYELQIEWKYAGAPADIRVNYYDLSEKNCDVSVKYINFNEPYKYTTSSGFVIIKSNDGYAVSGFFGLKISAEYSTGNNNIISSITDGTFEIKYPEK